VKDLLEGVKRSPAQVMGVLVMLVAFVLAAFYLYWSAVITFLIVGLLDVVLVLSKQKTISQWVHKQFGKWIDFLIAIGLLTFVWLVYGIEGFLPVLMGVIVGHLFTNGD